MKGPFKEKTLILKKREKETESYRMLKIFPTMKKSRLETRLQRKLETHLEEFLIEKQ